MMRISCVFASLVAGMAIAQTPKPAEKKGAEVKLAGMKATAPAGWVSQKPANRLRLFQFKLPKAVGDKEDGQLFALEMYGKPADLLTQLKNLFVLPADIPENKVLKQSELKVGDSKLTVLDIQGTYLVKNKPIDEAVKETRPDYRMIAVLWESKDGGYTIRLIGPKNTMARHAKPFMDWLKSFK